MYNWIDIIVVVVWMFYVWHGWGKGFYESIAELSAWLLTWFLLVYYLRPIEHALIRNIGLSKDWAPVVALFFMVLLSGISAYLVFRTLLQNLSRQNYSALWHFVLVSLPTILAGGMMVMLFLVVVVLFAGGVGEDMSVASGSWFFEKTYWLLDSIRK